MLEDLLPQFQELQRDFKNNKTDALRQLANQTIRIAAIHNNRLQAEIAVIAYALHKLLVKEHIQDSSRWKASQKIIEEKLEQGSQFLRKRDQAGFEKTLFAISTQIKQTDNAMGNFVENLIEKSRVKQASSLYALGLSLGQASALTNANKKALFNYIGYTKMHDEQPSKTHLNDRVQALEELFE